MVDIALLDSESGTPYYDIGLNGNGDLAVIRDDSSNYLSTKQEVVILFRLFLGEYDFDTTLGIDWKSAFRGEISQNEFIFDMEEQMQQLENVEECVVNLEKEGRSAFFKINITLTTGEQFDVNIQ